MARVRSYNPHLVTDKSGKPVGFYPAQRRVTKGKTHSTPIPTAPTPHNPDGSAREMSFQIDRFVNAAADLKSAMFTMMRDHATQNGQNLKLLEEIKEALYAIEIPAPVADMRISNMPSHDRSEVLQENTVSLLEQILNKEPQQIVLGGDSKPDSPVSIAPPAQTFKRIKSKRQVTESFSFNGTSVVLKQIPIRDSEKVYTGGQRFIRGSSEDYTIIGKTITPVSSWPVGIKVVVDYDI